MNLIAFHSFLLQFCSRKSWSWTEVVDTVVISIMAINFTLNSCSKKLRRLNSHDNSKAVKIGSLEDKAIKLGLARALQRKKKLLAALKSFQVWKTVNWKTIKKNLVSIVCNLKPWISLSSFSVLCFHSPVGIDSGTWMSQRIFLSRRYAFIAATSSDEKIRKHRKLFVKRQSIFYCFEGFSEEKK